MVPNFSDSEFNTHPHCRSIYAGHCTVCECITIHCYITTFTMSFRQLVSGVTRFIQKQLRTALRNTQSQNTQTKQQQRNESLQNDSAWKNTMKTDEASSILNLDKITSTDLNHINERFNYLFKRNDVALGGSFYIQSKIYVAKQTLEQAILTGTIKPPNDNNNHN